LRNTKNDILYYNQIKELNFKGIKVTVKENVEYDVLTYEEFDKVLKKCHNPGERLMFKTLYESGARSDTLLNL